jgi:hypothetical protein
MAMPAVQAVFDLEHGRADIVALPGLSHPRTCPYSQTSQAHDFQHRVDPSQLPSPHQWKVRQRNDQSEPVSHRPVRVGQERYRCGNRAGHETVVELVGIVVVLMANAAGGICDNSDAEKDSELPDVHG